MRDDKRIPFQQANDPSAVTHPVTRRANPSRPWVLLGEDDPDMRELLLHVLEGRGYRVSVAKDGHELSLAIREVRREQTDLPDLMISDVQMPKLSGLHVLKNLRRAGWDVPVIIITAFPDRHTQKAVHDLDAELIPKPFAVEDLLRRADAVLSPSP